MTILIDAGNTRVKLGWVDAGGAREPQVAAFAHDELESSLPAWLAAQPASHANAIGVNVAGDTVGSRIAQLLQAAGCGVTWLGATAQALGLSNGYARPGQLGTDRWVGMLGLWAHPRHQPPEGPARTQILASFGTATTIDTISPEGRFEGGVILPGLRLMLTSLVTGTANLPLAGGSSAAFPSDTHQAIATGALAAQAGAVLRQMLMARERFADAPLRLAVTGGAWPDVQPELCRLLAQARLETQPWIMDNPVLDGLAMLATRA
nr:type III pantothenate kinase [Pseudomonas sp.]